MAPLTEKLDDLRVQIMSGAIGHSRDWGGAGVVVGPSPFPEISDVGFYPDSVYVATKHHRELSWLFEELRVAFESRIDFINKFEFFGRLADTAILYLKNHGDPNDPELLLTVLLDRCMLLHINREAVSEVDG